jgi:hypothetical protein
MAAGVADHVWSLEEIAALLDLGGVWVLFDMVSIPAEGANPSNESPLFN